LKGLLVAFRSVSNAFELGDGNMTQQDDSAPLSPTPLKDVAFDPEALSILGDAFDKASAAFQSQRNDNAARAALAKGILHLATTGERDAARLLDGALGRNGKTSRSPGRSE
jgi:hypothetical protein